MTFKCPVQAQHERYLCHMSPSTCPVPVTASVNIQWERFSFAFLFGFFICDHNMYLEWLHTIVNNPFTFRDKLQVYSRVKLCLDVRIVTLLTVQEFSLKIEVVVFHISQWWPSAAKELHAQNKKIATLSLWNLKPGWLLVSRRNVKQRLERDKTTGFWKRYYMNCTMNFWL